MAVRTSLYLKDDLEEEIKSRARRRLDSDEPGPMGHVITRHLYALFGGYELCRGRVAEKLTYEEMRFLLYVVSSVGWDEDDLGIVEDLPHYVQRYWANVCEDSAKKPDDEIAEARAKDTDWLYWDQVDPNALAERIEAMHPFDVIALMDGLKTVLMSERHDREIVRLFKGIKRPV